MNPIHLMIAETFLAANDDRDAATFGADPQVRLAKRYRHPRRGRARAQAGYMLARGLTGFSRAKFDTL